MVAPRLADKEVKAPVFLVVAPMAVLLIPVAVVLKLLEVKVMSLAPVLMDEALSPDKLRAPEVPVKLIAPVVRVKPLLAVSVLENRPVPVTSNLVVGVKLLIPMLPLVSIVMYSLFPSIIRRFPSFAPFVS